jgi:HipA-like kinase
MLPRATPTAFDRAMGNGRTKPALLICETQAGEEVEVVAKFSANCDQGVINLAREVIAACLAGDLGLPIPTPYLLDITPAWATSVIDATIRANIQRSAPVAFGSSFAGAQFSAWNDGITLRPAMVPLALATFVFDAIIQNPDRRSGNPNCLVRGDAFRIFDHELAFAHGLILGWKPPWTAGSLQPLEQPGFHIFRRKLRGENLDFASIRESWKKLSDSRIDGYAATVPVEWAQAAAVVAGAIALIKSARDQIDACLVEIQRVLA